jgi:antitoxin component of RelBE/YafQ-DinJ toxin-antitoxin module
VPNADTIRAIEDVRMGRNISRSFSSVEELMEDLNAED